MRRLEHWVTAQEEGRTVKSLALKALRLSAGQFSSLKFRHAITVDGAPAFAADRLHAGQMLAVMLDEPAAAIRPCPLSLSIPYRDQDYLIVDKPAPLPSLPSCHQEGATLQNVLYAALDCPKEFVYRPVNRLDKGTSGLMVVALNAHAQQLLQKQLHTDAFTREYLAVCRGAPETNGGRINLPIAKAGDGARRIVSLTGKPAATRFWVVRRGKTTSVLRLRLETGRTHQIRVHLAAMGCPIVGDYLYGAPCDALPGRFALHAAFVSFRHPLTGALIAAESPLPPELAAQSD